MSAEVEAAAVVENMAALSDDLDKAQETLNSARKRLDAACEAIMARDRAGIADLEDKLAKDRRGE